jgi:hypothetical protein
MNAAQKYIAYTENHRLAVHPVSFRSLLIFFESPLNLL